MSHADPQHVFKMPPTYAANSAAFIGAANIYGTSTLATQCVNSALSVISPANYQAISVLWASGGSGLVDITVTHQDGTTENSEITTFDWSDASTAYAWLAMGRVSFGLGARLAQYHEEHHGNQAL